MRWAFRLLLVLVVWVLAVIGVTGCGGGGGAAKVTASTSSRSTTEGGSQAAAVVADKAPNAVVVRIGGYPITKATVDHWMVVYAKSAGQIGALAKPESKQFAELKESALGQLVYLHWLVSSAKEYGAEVSAAAAKQANTESDRKSFPTAAKLAAFLAKSGQSVGDLELQTRAGLVLEKLRNKIQRGVPTVSHAEVAAYYAANLAKYAVPEERALKIVRALRKPAALQAKHEIEGGKSFAAVVAASHVGQPIYSSHGLVIGLSFGVYAEAPLNNAIFSAKPDVLTGPVHIPLGYYVFEVKRITKAYRHPLAQVEAGIRQQLPELRYLQTLEAFLSRWKSRWSARTVCEPGYVIWKCRGFKGIAPHAEEPTSFY